MPSVQMYVFVLLPLIVQAALSPSIVSYVNQISDDLLVDLTLKLDEQNTFAQNFENTVELSNRRLNMIHSRAYNTFHLDVRQETDILYRTRNQTNKQRFEKLSQWLARGGVNVSNVEVREKNRNDRGIFAKTNLNVSEVIISIPLSHIIHTERAINTPIGRQMWKMGFSGAHWWVFNAVFILVERYNVGSFWEPYLATLPESFSHHPFYWNQSQLLWLQGSSVLPRVQELMDSTALTYYDLMRLVPELNCFSYEEFSWAARVVYSRSAAAIFNGKNTEVLVPFVDVINHRHEPQAKWIVDSARNVFQTHLKENVTAGEEIFNFYNPNMTQIEYFTYYGFTSNSSITPKTAQIVMHVHPEDVFYDSKKRYLDGWKRCTLTGEYDSAKSFECLSWARLAGFQGDGFLQFDPLRVGPLSFRAEERALTILADAAKQSLKRFPTSLLEDNRILEALNNESINNSSFDWNYYNAVVLRQSEKEILEAWVSVKTVAEDLLRHLTKHKTKWDTPVEDFQSVVATWCEIWLPEYPFHELTSQFCQFIMTHFFPGY